MKKIQNFQNQQLTSETANNLKGGGSLHNYAMGFCEWYVSLGDAGKNSGFLTYLNGVAEGIVNG